MASLNQTAALAVHEQHCLVRQDVDQARDASARAVQRAQRAPPEQRVAGGACDGQTMSHVGRGLTFVERAEGVLERDSLAQLADLLRSKAPIEFGLTEEHHLAALGRDEVEQYLAHRLRIAGFRGDRLFTPSAARLVHRRSGGLPRLINVIAHKAMLLAFSEGVQVVRPQHVKLAVADTPAARQYWTWRWFGFTCLLLSAGSMSWLLMS